MRPKTVPPPSLPALAGVICCGCVNLSFAVWAVITRPALNSDFKGLWSFAGFARRHAAQLYQTAPLQAFQQRIYPGFDSFFPYQYPPDFLLFSGWQSDFSFAAAAWIWTLAGVTALGASAALLFPPKRRWFAIAAVLASPASLLNGAAGETGYFTAALLLAGFALLPARPALAGIAFGLLTIKPQLVLLIPIALLARRDAKAILAAAITLFTLLLLSNLVFPPVLWLDWLRSLPVYQAQYLAAGKTLNLHSLVTPLGNLIVLGVSPSLAWSLQAVASLGVAVAVFRVFRHGPYHLAVAAIFTGTFLCAPHAYAYDSLPLVAAMLLLSPASTAGRAFCALIYLAPVLLLTGAASWFVYSIPETLLLATIMHLAIRASHPPDTGYEPVSPAESC